MVDGKQLAIPCYISVVVSHFKIKNQIVLNYLHSSNETF